MLGKTTHTEAGPTALGRAQAVVAFLAEKGVLRQQMRAEACPLSGGEHGESCASFLVIQSVLLPKRLSFAPGSDELDEKAEPLLDKVVRMMAQHTEVAARLELTQPRGPP